MQPVTHVYPYTWVASRFGPDYREDSPNGAIANLVYQKYDVKKLGSPILDLGYTDDNFSTKKFEESGEGVAPLYFYLSQDIVKPFEPGNLIRMFDHILMSMEEFPFCYWLERESEPGSVQSKIGEVDCCLLFLVCLFLDSETEMNVDDAIDQIFLPGVFLPYKENFGVSKYVDYKLTRIKQSEKYKLEDVYDWCASKEGAPDRDSIIKRIRRWRKGESTPKLEYFFQFFSFFLRGANLKEIFSECALIGMFHTVQLIQKYRLAETPSFELLNQASFYRERVHFWHEKLLEQYKDVIVRRISEKQQKESGPD